MRTARRFTALVLLAAASACAAAQDLRNWFDDPFFAVSQGRPGCVEPLGPRLTFEQQRREAHWRAERGTSCWLAGRCAHSNAYVYDKALAAPVKAALQAVPGVQRSSVWVTIQRRWVFLEGCVADAAQAAALEAAAKSVPDVEVVVPALDVGVPRKPRYAVRPATTP
jgi:hypothetical protein